MNNFYRRKNCRLCQSDNVQSVLKMASTPIGDTYLKRIEHQRIYPVELFLCNNCGHAQLLDVLDSKAIYSDYIYKTSDSLNLIEHFRETVDSILDRIKLENRALVVDIGSNDGSFLNLFKEREMNVVGVEPAEKIAHLAIKKGIETEVAFFSPSIARKIRNEKGKAKIVTCNNTFANIDDLSTFIEGVKEILDTKGIFVLETGYVLDWLEKNIFDNIYHEHLSYFSVKPLYLFFREQGMELVDVERIKTKGGSLRCFVQHPFGPLNKSKAVDDLIMIEKSLGVQEPIIFREFGLRVNKISSKLRDLLTVLKKQGKKIAGYGASVGVTTVLYNFCLDKNLIEFLVDDNPVRQDLFSPGLHIPVKSPQELYEKNIDYVVILAWQYTEPIIKKHQKYLEQGGNFIVFLPEFKIINKDNFQENKPQ